MFSPNEIKLMRAEEMSIFWAMKLVSEYGFNKSIIMLQSTYEQTTCDLLENACIATMKALRDLWLDKRGASMLLDNTCPTDTSPYLRGVYNRANQKFAIR